MTRCGKVKPCMHRGEGEKQDEDKREEPTQCNAQWQARCEQQRAKAQRRSKTKKREMSNHKCKVRCEVLKPALTQKAIGITTKS